MFICRKNHQQFPKIWGIWIFHKCNLVILQVVSRVYNPEEELAKFGYRPERNVSNFKKPPVFWQLIGTHWLNMVISWSGSFSSKSGHIFQWTKILCTLWHQIFFATSMRRFAKKENIGINQALLNHVIACYEVILCKEI